MVSVGFYLLHVVLGGLTGYFFANQLPFFGLLERLNIGTLMIWIFVLSLRFSCATEQHTYNLRF